MCPLNRFCVGKATDVFGRRVTVHGRRAKDPNLRVLGVDKHFHSCSDGWGRGRGR